MKYHLVSTYQRFPYYYYLAAKSLLLTQDNPEITIWTYNEPDNEYWQSLLDDDRFTIEHINDDELPYFNWECGRKPVAYIADIVGYMKLYEFGGIYTDFDILALRDFSYLLKNDVYVTSMFEGEDRLEHYVMMAKPHSKTIQLALEYGLNKLERKDMGPDWRGDPGWGSTGPDAILHGVKHSGENIDICTNLSIFLSWYWGRLEPYEEIPNLINIKGWKVTKDSHLLHMWGHGNDTLDTPKPEHVLRRITPEWIKSSKSLYAKLVRKTIPESERL